MIRRVALLLSALVILAPSQLSEAGIGLGGVAGGNITGGGAPPPTFVFSYPPSGPPVDQSVSFTNSFGTFSWTNHQIEDPGGTAHEQYGMWFLTLTPSATSQSISAIALSNSSFLNSTANAVVGNVSVTMNPVSPAFTGGLTLTGANTGGFQLVGAGCANGGVCTLEANAAGTTTGTYNDANIVATQASANNSPQHLTPTLFGNSQTCGPDPAPPQAAAQGFTCETYRWTCGGGIPNCVAGPGDTIAEIDTGKTYLPGFKWYYGTTNLDGHVTVSSDFTVNSNGQIINPAATTDSGLFILNTCGAPVGQITVGQFFREGWYVEFVGEWNRSGFTMQTGFYGVGWPQKTYPIGGQLQWELDNPDAYADDQQLVFWGGGGFQGLNNAAGFVRHGDADINTGHKFGVMSTQSAVTWWFDDTANSSVDFAGSLSGLLHPIDVYNTSFCFGNELTLHVPTTLDSVKVWQAHF